MLALIVGAGIGGPTLAFWLERAGYQVTLVEGAPELRRGGYLVDFWGSGFDVADRMSIVPRLMDVGYRVREVREVSSRGRPIAGSTRARCSNRPGGATSASRGPTSPPPSTTPWTRSRRSSATP